MDNGAVTVVVVGSGHMSEDDLLALARARTLIGREGPVAAVRHLCPPRTRVVVGDPDSVPDGAERPVVLLRTPESRTPGSTSSTTAAEQSVAHLVRRARDVDLDAAARARARHDRLAKPPGSLGVIEDVGVRLAALAGACPPPVPRAPAVLVAAGDHGVVAQGVSAWPSEVTTAMVGVCLSGGAGVSVLARSVGAAVRVLDVGVAGDVPDAPGLVRRKVRRGTADLSVGPAMSRDEAAQAVLAGAEVAGGLMTEGADLLVTGDLGIGNTTAAACLVGVFTGTEAERVVGRGAGIGDHALTRKRQIVGQAVASRAVAADDPLGVLAACGGLEHAALVGMMLSASARRVPVLLDGVITVSAALAAVALAPAARGALFAGHRSVEPGAGVGLEHLGLRPLLDLDMRLGEGTGGLLAVPLVMAAARLLSDMTTIDTVIDTVTGASG